MATSDPFFASTYITLSTISGLNLVAALSFVWYSHATCNWEIFSFVICLRSTYLDWSAPPPYCVHVLWAMPPLLPCPVLKSALLICPLRTTLHLIKIVMHNVAVITAPSFNDCWL